MFNKTSFVVPVAILAGFVLYFVHFSFFALGTVVLYDIAIFKRSCKSNIRGFKRFSVELKFKFSHDIYSCPCFFSYVVYMFVP